MKKRLRTLLCLMLALGVLTGGYFLVAALTREEPAENAPPLLSLADDALKSLSFTYQGETVTLLRDGESWRYDGDGAFPLDTAQVDTMAGVLRNLTAASSIDAPAELSEYGLDDPQCVIVVEKSDGTSVELRLGDYNSLVSAYYLQTPDGLYTVSSAVQTAFCKTLADLAVKEEIPALEDVTAVTVNSAGQSAALAFLGGGDAGVYTRAFQWFYNGDRAQPLDTARVISYLSALDVVFSKCVAWNADDDALAAYGLGAAASSVTVEYGGGAFGLLLGADTEQGRYARIDGSRMVYLIASADGEAILSADYASLRPDTLLSLDWDEVSAFDVTVGEQAVTLIKDADGGWTCRGTALDSTLADNLKAALTGLTLAETADVAEDAPAVSGAVYQTRAGWEQLDFSLTPAGESWLGALGENAAVPVTAESVQALQAAIQAVTDSFAAAAVTTD